ncbi:MAG TPA: GTPase [Anaeromyxobacteraceae bacterium]|nr:GTPase [Anaeromyxobacteraceae bacterium]
MSTVNPLAREISAKIVYYGPGLSGKTTSLQHIHAAVRPETRGQLISLSTEGDRTLFFDFMPLKIEQVRGLTLRLQLYTVPGQVFYDATRKLVLNGADGVVFVADSQRAAADSNAEAMSNLATNLGELGIDLAAFPVVVQYNKRDLAGVMPVEEMRRELNPRGVPDFETVARRGDNVLEALREVTRLVVKELKARQPVRRAPMQLRLDPGADIASQVSAHASRSPDAVQAPPAAEPRGDRAALLPLSFTRMFPQRAQAIADIEAAIRERTWGAAVRAAAHEVAEILNALPASESAAAARATLLGLDGREYLRLSRLAARPDAALAEPDALFALYLLVAALVKDERV